MKRTNAGRDVLLLAVACLIAVPAVRAQESQQPSEKAKPEAPTLPPTFGVSSAVVRVDVVVRDDEGRPVRDLTANDFELYEDGEPQTLDSFHVVALDGLPRGRRAAPASQPDDDAGRAAPAATAPRPAPAQRTPSVIAFVFDRISPDARQIAHRAAIAYAERGHEDGDIVGVFSIDLALHALQPFTQSLDLVEAAFDTALVQAHTPFANHREDAREVGKRVERSVEALTAMRPGGGISQEQAEDLATRVTNDQAEVEMLRAFDLRERDQQGFATTNGLKAVVEGLRAIPGRKTLIFFSEGLALPASVLHEFRSVIAQANRAQVSIYSIDVGGLRVDSGTSEARDELGMAVNRRLWQESLGLDIALDGPMSRGLERGEDYLRLNPEAGLGELARDTGGFLVRDSNDASIGFRRIEEDMRFHYMLAYTPTNLNYDGRFREISVRVRRPDVHVQSRKGYFAVPPETIVPARAFEATALAQLERQPRPEDFPLHTTALSFPEPRRPGRVSVLVELPGNAVEYTPPEREGDDYHADFSIVVRVRNEKGVEVDRLSQQYLLSVPQSGLDDVRAGNVLFYKESNLRPGRYGLDVVAYDAKADKASVRHAGVVVPESAAPVRLSSVALLDRVEDLPPRERGNGNPLVFGRAMLYPHMGEPVHRSHGPNLGFYFTAYGGEHDGGTQATIDLLRGHETLVSLPTTLPAADDQGRIQYAGALPLEALTPGDFTLRVSVTDGASTATREASFRVTE